MTADSATGSTEAGRHRRRRNRSFRVSVTETQISNRGGARAFGARWVADLGNGGAGDPRGPIYRPWGGLGRRDGGGVQRSPKRTREENGIEAADLNSKTFERVRGGEGF